MRSNSFVIPLPREQVPDWLLALRNGFLALLVSLGLKTRTITGYVHALDWLCAEVGRRGLMTPDGVDEATFGLIRDQLPARLSDYSRKRWTCALDRFIAHLVNEGAIAAVPQPALVPTALDTLCADYGTWLRTRHGSAPSTVKARQGQLRNFLTFRFGNAAPGDLNAIIRANSVAWLEATDEAGLAGARSKAASLRSLFRFLYATGRIEQNLALCVPSIAGPRSPAPTRHCRVAAQTCPSLGGKKVTPHSLRHGAAMALLHEGVGCTVIVLWLGHESVETTQVYLHADFRIKEKAMEKTRPVGVEPGRFKPDNTLLGFLKSL